MLLFRAQKHEAREEKGRKDWPPRNRVVVRNPPEELHVSALEIVGILLVIEMIENAGSSCIRWQGFNAPVT